jgi:hypothetical protein
MCDCRQKTEARLLNALPEQLPKDHANLRVSLAGYALMMGTGTAQSRQVMPIDITYQAPTKAGVMKEKKQKMSMMANYCMFCGEPYEKVEEA